LPKEFSLIKIFFVFFPPGSVLAAQWIQRLGALSVLLLLEAHPLYGRQLLAEMAAHAPHHHHPGARHVGTAKITEQ